MRFHLGLDLTHAGVCASASSPRMRAEGGGSRCSVWLSQGTRSHAKDGGPMRHGKERAYAPVRGKRGKKPRIADRLAITFMIHRPSDGTRQAVHAATRGLEFVSLVCMN